MHHTEYRALLFFYKKTVANQCITMVFILKTFKQKKIYTLKIVYPFLIILAIGHRQRHVIFFKQNNMPHSLFKIESI